MSAFDDTSQGDRRPTSGGDGPSGPGCLSLEMLERVRVEARPTDTADAARLGDAAAHLRDCSECRGRIAEMQETEEFIASFTASLRRRSGAGGGVSSGAAGSAERSLRDDFPSYAIESILNVGGQGPIYRARQLATGRVVAIKVPLGDAVSRPGKRYRFRREIELTARLDHPSMVRVFGACEACDGRIGCVMELVSGMRFDDWATAQRAEGRAGRRRIVEAVRDLADAVGHAHQRAVLHRDLKPGNVIVDASGVPRLPTAQSGSSDAALDAIVLKAIASSKDRRYGSAVALADDLRRWLEGSAVHARLDRRWYRLCKSLRRHRRATILGAVALAGFMTLTFLWLESRAASLRAELTARVRDAGTVEAHWATVADLRATTRDNFPLGEARLRDLLIRPEPALIAAATEGPETLGRPIGTALALPTSPVYWALWEACVRTPMVASLPSVAAGPVLFERRGPQLLELTPEGIRCWNWRTTRVERELILAERPPGFWTFGMLNAERAIVRSRPGRGIVVDLDSGASTSVDFAAGTLDGPAELGRQMLVCVRGAVQSPPQLEVFDFSEGELLPRWSKQLPGDVLRMRMDSAEQFVGVISKAGDVLAFELSSGRELYQRLRSEHPRYNLLHSPGVPGELLLASHEGFATLRLEGGTAMLAEATAWTGRTPMDDLGLIETSPDGDRYTIVVNPDDPDLFVTTHDSGRIRLWRVHDDEQSQGGSTAGASRRSARIELVCEIGSHAGPVMSAAFHPSGRILATGGGSAELRDVRLWDIERGRERAALSLFDNGVFTLAFSPDGRWLAAGGEADRNRLSDGGQLSLIDLAEAEGCFAGNLEYHLARSRHVNGHDPESAEALRARFSR